MSIEKINSLHREAKGTRKAFKEKYNEDVKLWLETNKKLSKDDMFGDYSSGRSYELQREIKLEINNILKNNELIDKCSELVGYMIDDVSYQIWFTRQLDQSSYNFMRLSNIILNSYGKESFYNVA